MEAEANPSPDPNPNPNPQPDPNPPAPATKYEVTVTQPANGKIEVSPSLPADGKVDKGSEFTFTLSANTGHKVKELIINGITYSDVTDNTITKKVKIEKNTAVSAVVEAEASPTPDTGIFTDTQGNKVTIAPVKIYGGEITGYRLTGDIYIEEINSEAFKAKLDTLNGKELYTDSLNINCFTNQNSTLTAKEITPELLTGVLTIGKEKKFSILTLNNETPNGPIDILFTTKDSDGNKYFDISSLAKFRFSDTFKLDNSSNILLGGEKKDLIDGYGQTVSHYPMISELMTLIQDNRLNDKMKIGSILLSGNVGEVLKYLNNAGISINGKTIKEVEEGKSIKFLSSIGKLYSPTQSLCNTEFNTGYFGKKSSENLSIEQLKQYHNRAESHAMQIEDATIKNLNSKNYTGDFVGDMLTNVSFVESDLSEMSFESCETGPGYLKFEDSTLPKTMEGSVIHNLILENSQFPDSNLTLGKTIKALPKIDNSLKIYNLKNRLFDKWTKEEIEKFPYKKENTNFIEDNTTGSIQKQQSQLLALLQTQNKSRG